jgi:hypothetical protein
MSRTHAPANKIVLPANSEDADWCTNRQAHEKAHKANQARMKSGRRRLVDPTTCDRDYSAAEMEFLQAMQKYKQTSGRMFPTWGEVLEVLQGLGYERTPDVREDSAR